MAERCGENDLGKIKVAVENVMRNATALLLNPTPAGDFIGVRKANQ